MDASRNLVSEVTSTRTLIYVASQEVAQVRVGQEFCWVNVSGADICSRFPLFAGCFTLETTCLVTTSTGTTTSTFRLQSVICFVCFVFGKETFSHQASNIQRIFEGRKGWKHPTRAFEGRASQAPGSYPFGAAGFVKPAHANK